MIGVVSSNERPDSAEIKKAMRLNSDRAKDGLRNEQIRRARADSRIPMDQAFREVVGFVTGILKDSGEQWSDQSRQDFVSTVFISAQKLGILKVWERP